MTQYSPEIFSNCTITQLLRWLHRRAPANAHLQSDSREIELGDIFVACPGNSVNSYSYINEALKQGASAILVDLPKHSHSDIKYPTDNVAFIPGLQSMLGTLANIWYGQPSLKMRVVAVTGTNGKTSCIHWIAQAFKNNGYPCGTIGTLGIIFPDGYKLDNNLTTPGVLKMHRILAAMYSAGTQIVAIEASSIGIDAGRLDGVHITLAAFTNLSSDHLDYHQTLENYEEAKSKLFLRPEVLFSIINRDDDVGLRIIDLLPENKVLGYSINQYSIQPGIFAKELRANLIEQSFNLQLLREQTPITTKLLGYHNISNLLLVAGVLHYFGLSLRLIAHELATVQPPEGRLQRVELPLSSISPRTHPENPLVIIDYSHNPESLRCTLNALQPLAKSRYGGLACVFGCGGNRDASKRAEMGKVASELSNKICLTDDNPRCEESLAIIKQICSGIPEGTDLIIQPDRAQAIMRTIWSSSPEDIVLIAGKGHENYQEIHKKKYFFSDYYWSQLALLLPRAQGVSTDTRSIGQNELFLALKGENFDGHDYIAQAQVKNAMAAIVARPVITDCLLPQLVLGDTHQALMKIGAAWRSRFSLTMIAITGSNGKTTTKEMIAAILRRKRKESEFLATIGNQNNEIGVALNLLRLRKQHQVAVLELGMNHPDEIKTLAALVLPTIAVITNAQREHLKFIHSAAAAAEENSKTVCMLPPGGIAIYPGDDPYVTPLWDKLSKPYHSLRFGLRSSADICARDLQVDPQQTKCRLIAPQGETKFCLPIPGLHNLKDALAAIACTSALGIKLDDAALALTSFKAIPGRTQPVLTKDSTFLIDDTYNSNPDSVLAALDVLINLPPKRVLVLGDMAELGQNSTCIYYEIGFYARRHGIEFLVTLGRASRSATDAFGAGSYACETIEEVTDILYKLHSSSVLVKGSRFMRMERVIKRLVSLKENNVV